MRVMLFLRVTNTGIWRIFAHVAVVNVPQRAFCVAWVLRGCCVGVVWVLCGCCVGVLRVVCVLYVCCVCVVCVLYVCCVGVVWVLCGCCVGVVCVLYVCCMCVVCVLSKCCVGVELCYFWQSFLVFILCHDLQCVSLWTNNSINIIYIYIYIMLKILIHKEDVYVYIIHIHTPTHTRDITATHHWTTDAVSCCKHTLIVACRKHLQLPKILSHVIYDICNEAFMT